MGSRGWRPATQYGRCGACGGWKVRSIQVKRPWGWLACHISMHAAKQPPSYQSSIDPPATSRGTRLTTTQPPKQRWPTCHISRHLTKQSPSYHSAVCPSATSAATQLNNYPATAGAVCPPATSARHPANNHQRWSTCHISRRPAQQLPSYRSAVCPPATETAIPWPRDECMVKSIYQRCTVSVPVSWRGACGGHHCRHTHGEGRP